MKHFNQLTPGEVERLALLMEECAEVQQAIGKILRHGYERKYLHHQGVSKISMRDIYDNLHVDKKELLLMIVNRIWRGDPIGALDSLSYDFFLGLFQALDITENEFIVSPHFEGLYESIKQP